MTYLTPEQAFSALLAIFPDLSRIERLPVSKGLQLNLGPQVMQLTSETRINWSPGENEYPPRRWRKARPDDLSSTIPRCRFKDEPNGLWRYGMVSGLRAAYTTNAVKISSHEWLCSISPTTSDDYYDMCEVETDSQGYPLSYSPPGAANGS